MRMTTDTVVLVSHTCLVSPHRNGALTLPPRMALLGGSLLAGLPPSMPPWGRGFSRLPASPSSSSVQWEFPQTWATSVLDVESTLFSRGPQGGGQQLWPQKAAVTVPGGWDPPIRPPIRPPLRPPICMNRALLARDFRGLCYLIRFLEQPVSSLTTAGRPFESLRSSRSSGPRTWRSLPRGSQRDIRCLCAQGLHARGGCGSRAQNEQL